jgi:hypothetical protein
LDHYVDESDVPQTPPHSSRTSPIIVPFAFPRDYATIITTADVGYQQTYGVDRADLWSQDRHYGHRQSLCGDQSDFAGRHTDLAYQSGRPGRRGHLAGPGHGRPPRRDARPRRELQRRYHPHCEGPRSPAKEISRGRAYHRLSVIQRFNVLCNRSQIRI